MQVCLVGNPSHPLAGDTLCERIFVGNGGRFNRTTCILVLARVQGAAITRRKTALMYKVQGYCVVRMLSVFAIARARPDGVLHQPFPRRHRGRKIFLTVSPYTHPRSRAVAAVTRS